MNQAIGWMKAYGDVKGREGGREKEDGKGRKGRKEMREAAREGREELLLEMIIMYVT